MILVDNSKKCSAIVHLVTQPALESCPQEIRPIFDASRKSEFHTFLDGVLHVWIGLGDEETLTLSHVKSAAAIAAKTAAHAHAASATENTTMPEDKAPATNVIARAALRMGTYFRPSACALFAFFTFLAITAPPMNYRGCPIR